MLPVRAFATDQGHLLYVALDAAKGLDYLNPSEAIALACKSPIPVKETGRLLWLRPALPKKRMTISTLLIGTQDMRELIAQAPLRDKSKWHEMLALDSAALSIKTTKTSTCLAERIGTPTVLAEQYSWKRPAFRSYSLKENCGHVYVVEGSTSVKVGRSNCKNIERRTRAVQTQQGYEGKVWVSAPLSNYERMEKEAHALLSPYRALGEHFSLPFDAVVSKLELLLSAKGRLDYVADFANKGEVVDIVDQILGHHRTFIEAGAGIRVGHQEAALLATLRRL